MTNNLRKRQCGQHLRFPAIEDISVLVLDSNLHFCVESVIMIAFMTTWRPGVSPNDARLKNMGRSGVNSSQANGKMEVHERITHIQDRE